MNALQNIPQSDSCGEREPEKDKPLKASLSYLKAVTGELSSQISRLERIKLSLTGELPSDLIEDEVKSETPNGFLFEFKSEIQTYEGLTRELRSLVDDLDTLI